MVWWKGNEKQTEYLCTYRAGTARKAFCKRNTQDQSGTDVTEIGYT